MPSTYTSRRGAVDPISLIVIGLLVVVVAAKAPSATPGRDHWWQFWQKNPVEQVQKSQAELDAAKQAEIARLAAAQAKIDAENRKQLQGAHEASVATVNAIEAAQAVTAAGQPPKKELETAHSLAVVTKDGLDAATGETVAPARVRELETMVAQLNAGVAAGQTALKGMQSALDVSLASEKALREQNLKESNAAALKIKAAEDKNLATVQTAEKWALQRDAIAKKYEDLWFYGEIVVGLLVFVWLASIFFPILSRFFPALKPLSTAIGAVWAPGVQYVQGKAHALNTDFVGMTEWLKTELAKRATPEEMAAIKATMSKNWMTVSDGTAQAIEQIKTSLRM